MENFYEHDGDFRTWRKIFTDSRILSSLCRFLGIYTTFSDRTTATEWCMRRREAVFFPITLCLGTDKVSGFVSESVDDNFSALEKEKS